MVLSKSKEVMEGYCYSCGKRLSCTNEGLCIFCWNDEHQYCWGDGDGDSDDYCSQDEQEEKEDDYMD